MAKGGLQDWIGRTAEAEDVVTPQLVASFRATFGPHLAPSDDPVAPPGLHWCLAPEAVETSRLGPDGHPAKGDFLPLVPLPRRMWAGGELTLFAALRVNDRVRRRSTIEAIVEKHGKSGPLCFVTVLHELENDSGPVLNERHAIVYREAGPLLQEAGSADRKASPGFIGGVQEVTVDPVFLFRYSALTFNGHRIHYDAPYATQTEGYTGLVIHGPLQATLLLNRAAAIAQRSLQKFSYKAVSPAVGCQTLRAGATAIHRNQVSLAIEAENGRATMRATAGW
ncbi:MAG: MaoC family dehydratase N-terminal domain-containing protein [Parvibaculaceae bacterium]